MQGHYKQEDTMNSPERINPSEVKIGAAEAASEQSERLRKRESSVESPEHNRDSEAQHARKHAEAIFTKEAGKEHRHGGEPTASPAVIRKITQREKDHAYKKTLARVQSEMSTPARVFSQLIHAPVIEKTSEVIGSTAARPNALLFGSVTAFILLAAIYGVSQTYGYRLSGFEMIGSYALGWVAGLCIDYFKIMASGRLS